MQMTVPDRPTPALHVCVCVCVCVCVYQRCVPTLHSSHYLPAVDDNGSTLVGIGGMDRPEEVEQRSCQLGCAIVRPLAEVELQYSAQLSGHQLAGGAGRGEGRE